MKYMSIKNDYKKTEVLSLIINNISEYVTEICKFDSKLQRNGFDKNEVLLFRGQPDENYELLPAMGRNMKSVSILYEERNLIEMAKNKMPDIFHNGLSPVELLALLQHHGIPTRLLDITENSLVALYFACSSEPSKNGEVIVFKKNELDIATYPMINAIAESYKYAAGSLTLLGLFYGNVKNQPYFLEQKQGNEICYKTNEEGGNWVAECCKKPQFIYAPIRSIRQQIQQGRYILFPNHIEEYGKDDKKKKKYFVNSIDAISKNNEDILSLIEIPAEKKKEILYELRLFGICEEILFCDNIDIVCKNIKNTFDRKLNGNLFSST